MTPDIWKLVGVLVMAISLFISKRLRVDLVALMVLVSLVLLGLVSPKEALSGFSNPAVVTVWAVFILSGGLAVTGIAGVVGRRILQVAGPKEARLIVVIMVTAGVLSAFMNNVGVAALLLPVVMDICRRTRIPPSKLLIPLAYSSLLGGLMTLIGTPPNILVSEALSGFGEEPFQLFSFTPLGASVMAAGVLFMALIGRHLLPENESISGGHDEGELAEAYRVQEQLSVIEVRPGSHLAGKALKDTRLGSLLGVNVLAVLRDGRHRLAPDPETVLEEGNRLLVDGAPEHLEDLVGRGYLTLEASGVLADQLLSADIEVAEVGLTPGTDLEGKNLREVDFRKRFGVVVLAIRRDAEPVRTGLAEVKLKLGDVLLLMGGCAAIDALRSDPDFIGAGIEHASSYHLEDRLMRVVVPEDSVLVGKSLIGSRLGDRFGLGVMGIVRQGITIPLPGADETIESGDVLFMKGKPEDLETVDGLHQLELVPEAEAAAVDLESERIGLAEAVVSPRADIVGRTLQDLHFREKYGLNVVAISRQGKILRTDLASLPLQFGDALLLHGPREKLRLLGSEIDFIVLRGDAQQPVRDRKAPVAALVMVGVVLSVIVGWLPIYIAAIAGAIVMVLSKCLTMEEAYSYIEWRAVFLIAGMIPLGVAMQQTGAAELFTEVVISAVSGYGPLAVAAALFLVTAFGAQVMPTAAVAILMAPIAYNTATDLGISPHSLMMAVAMSASASFLSPVAHPANVLIMGPGGYQWGDYIKVGLPLTLVCMVVVLILLPILWAF